MIAVERFGHSTLDTPHLLAGLLESDDGGVARALDSLAIPREPLLAAATATLHTLPVDGGGQVHVAAATEEILERASVLARERGDSIVSDLDILLAAAERPDLAAGEWLERAGLASHRLREAAAKLGPDRAAVPSASAHTQARPAALITRTGVGYDSHRFEPGGPLALGGISIPGDRHLAGHSDGDAIAHAITDAVLGAAGEGDIGEMFPDTVVENRGRSSSEMLRLAVERVREAGWAVQHVDVAVVTEQPRIRPHVTEMRRALASALAVDPGCVSVKGKTNEGMGWIGRHEGLACIAVATLVSTRE